MRNKIIVFFATLFLVVMSVPAFAALKVIGTATYDDGSGSHSYKLIWDDDNNGKSVIWLDYSHAQAQWQPQMNWAAGLNSALSITWNSGISVTWSDPAWRLPNTVDGAYVYGCDGTTTGGYNITTSEMGHLFYTELGNQGKRYGSSCNKNISYGLQNTGPFANLIESWYWSGTNYTTVPNAAWSFYFAGGIQDGVYKNEDLYGLALRSGQVTENHTYYVPYLKSESDGSYWTGLCVSNNNDAAAQVTITPYKDSGTPCNDCIKTVNIVKNGQDIGQIAKNKTVTGWIKIDSNKKLTGTCFFGSALMADIPFISTLGRTLMVSQVAQDNLWDTIVMVCNPNNFQASFTMTYYSKKGMTTTAPAKTLPAMGSGTYHLNDIFPNMTLNAGKVKISSSGCASLAAFALYYDTKHGGSYYAGINADVIE